MRFLQLWILRLVFWDVTLTIYQTMLNHFQNPLVLIFTLHMLQISLLGWGLQLKRQNYNWFICLWVICIDTPCSFGAVKYPCNQRADYVTSSHNSFPSYSPCYMWPHWHYFQYNQSKIPLFWLTQDQRGAELSNTLYYQMVPILT